MFIPVLPALIFGYAHRFAPGQLTLKFNPPIGRTYKYKMTTSMKMSTGQNTTGHPMEMQMAMDMDMKAVSRTGNVTTMETRTGSPQVESPGNSQMAAGAKAMSQAMAGRVITAKIDSQYRPRGVSGIGAGMDSMFGNMTSMTFPDHPVRVGDTWSSNLDFGKLLGGMLGGSGSGMKMSGNVPMKFRLVNVVQRGGQSLAQISLIMKGDMTMSMAGQGTTMHLDASADFTVDTATGMTSSMKTISATSMKIGQMQMVQKMTQTMALR